MIGAMKPLTFIADMAPLNALGKLIAGWQSPLLIGGGAMSSAVRKTIDEASNGTAQDATAHVQGLMRRKSPTELAAIGDACDSLNATMKAMRDAVRIGGDATIALLAGERAANDTGVQDIRTLFSLDGGRTLRPFEALDHAAPIRCRSMSRSASSTTGRKASPASRTSRSRRPRSRRCCSTMRCRRSDPACRLRNSRRYSRSARPIAPSGDSRCAGQARLGLSLDAAPTTNFEPGEIYSVRAGLTDGATQHAILSAMIAVRDNGTEVLWRSGIA